MKHFRNHGFAHFGIISDMMPSHSKGAYIFHAGGKWCDPPPSTSTQPPNTLVMGETHRSLSSSNASAPPSAPSSFLSPSESQHNSGASSVLTSISRGKHKASVISSGESVAGTTVSETARKHNCNQPSARSQ